MRFPELACVLALLAVGCGTQGAVAPEGQEDPGVLDDPQEASLLSVEAERSDEVSTMFTVSWEATVPTRGHVEIAQDGVGLWRTPTTAEPGEIVSVPVVGLRSASTYTATVVAETEAGDELRSEALTLETGTLPSWMPVFTAASGPEGPPDGLMLLPVMSGVPGSEDHAIVMLDTEGEVVWFHEDATLDSTVVQLSADGQTLIQMTEGALLWRGLDGAVIDRVSIDGVHHTLAEHPDGSVATLVGEPVTLEGSDWLDQRLVEVTRDGEQRELWRVTDALDRIGVDLNDWIFDGELGHANAVAWDAWNDAWLVGLAEWGTVISVDRATGDTRWVLTSAGGGDLDFVGLEAWTHHHTLQAMPDGFALYVNLTEHSNCGRVVDVVVDEDAQEAEEVWSYGGETADTCHTTFSLGDVEHLDDGHTVITWSTNGLVEVIDDAGDQQLLVEIDFGYALGYGEWINSLQEPLDSP